MAGLADYTDFIASTGPAVFDGGKDLINDAVKNAPALARWMDGKDMAELLKGGKEITGKIMLDEQTTAENYAVGADFTWSDPQVLDYWTYDWRFTMDHMSLVDQEIILNGPEQMTGMGRFQQLTDIMKKQEARVMTSIYNFMSGKVWAEPDFNTMVGRNSATLIEQNSIPVFVHEYITGLYNGAGTAGTAWTSTGGINTAGAGNSRWDNRRVTYTTGATAQPKGSGGTVGGPQNDVISSFGRMFRKINYQQYRTFDQYMTQTPMNKVFIACSEKGITHYEESCRDRQDAFIKANDPAFPGTQYRGIPIEYHEELDTATVYPNHLTQASADNNIAEGTNNGGLNAIGPRYYWLHPKYITPVFHNQRYFHKFKPLPQSSSPEKVTIPYACYWNFICSSRRRLGIVSPSAVGLFTAY